MERYVDMKSPLTGGRVKEVSTTETKEFRKEKFSVPVRYYVCEDTGEQFTTTEQDTLQFNELYAQYRQLHGIPFPDEIREIRLEYGLNYSQISRLLGFGVNQYAKYEGGEMPSESNGKMIAAVADKNVALAMLKRCRTSFQEAEYQRILTSISMSETKDDAYAPLCNIVYRAGGRSIFNGYGGKSIPKLFEMVRFIVGLHGEIFPTKLNKVMFYADFSHYRKTGRSISGLTYRALNFGPVPDHYATIYDNVPGLDKKMIEVHGMVGTLLACNSDWAADLLSETEKDSIEGVVEKLRPLSVSELIRSSHEETGWQENSANRDCIPYQEAFSLKLV